MKKTLPIFLLLLLIITLCTSVTNAQFSDYTTKFGIQFNGLLPDTEFDKDLKPDNADFKFSYLGRLFLRFELGTEALEAEFGAGYGTLTGVDFNNSEWKTNIIPIDLRLILSPVNSTGWNPYLYGGIGALIFNVDTKPSVTSPNTPEEDGTAAFVPVGLGIEFALSENVLLDITGGYNFIFNDDINFYNNKDAYSESTVNDGYFSAGIGLEFVSGWGGSDHDMDGLTKREEEELGTDPENPDTDGDGLKDGAEVNTHLTNPVNPDTDGDGLSDGNEINQFKTNPNNADSDNDGLKDGEEVNNYKTDPLNTDTDNDGLKDGAEVTNYKTDPLRSDTDGDRLTDGEEVNTFRTDPLKSDTDGDTLNDGNEVKEYRTDPLKADTDGGTVDDGTEVNRGTNPNDPEDDVVKMEVPIVLEGITFATGKADITPESEKILQQALKTLQTYPEIIVEISGHTDDVGSSASNQKLSQKRADAVRTWLIQKGINPDRMIAVGYGEERPRVPNDSADNRRMNRRIEFKRIK
ncbi:MAG: hypothetical protein Kow0098_00650 [Ignavibacteriaceae bacterium]